MVEQINNIIVWVKSIIVVRSKEVFNEKSDGLGIRNPEYESCLNHFIDL